MAGLVRSRWVIASAVTAVVTAVALGPSAPVASALTRAKADQIALRVLQPARQGGHAVVFRLPSPLRAGSVVLQAGPSSGSGEKTAIVRRGGEVVHVTTVPHRPLAHPTWLYWEDLRPGAAFEHPSVLLLVDAVSGRVVRRQVYWWAPLVNGRPPAFLATRKAYYSAGFRIFANDVTTSKKGRRLSGRTGVRRPDLGPPDLHMSCMITIGDRSEAMFKGDFELANQVARELHLDASAATSVSSLSGLISAKTAAGCRDVLLFIAAHGWAATGSNIPHPNGGGNVAESNHATVTLKYRTGKDAAGKDVVEAETLDSEQVKTIMEAHPRVTFKVLVDSCFSGRWARDLDDEPNLRFIATASRPDQMSFGWAPPKTPDGRYFAYQKGSQKNGVVTYTTQTIEDHTTNHTEAGTFTNGIFRGLDTWAHSDAERAKTGDDLAKALTAAFRHQKDQNFSEQLGTAITIVHDYSHRTEYPEPAPHLAPMTALFNQTARKTTYEIHLVGAIGDDRTFESDVTFAWTLSIPADPNCAKGFRPRSPQPNQATWFHADTGEGGPCSHVVYDGIHSGHPGTVSVTVATPDWTCVATYFGTQGPTGLPTGTGPEPPACRLRPA